MHACIYLEDVEVLGHVEREAEGRLELRLEDHARRADVIVADAVEEDGEVEGGDEALDGRASHQLANVVDLAEYPPAEEAAGGRR